MQFPVHFAQGFSTLCNSLSLPHRRSHSCRGHHQTLAESSYEGWRLVCSSKYQSLVFYVSQIR